jgi:hypothetical protein
VANPGIRGSGEAGSSGTGNQVITSSASPQAGDLLLIAVNVNNASSGSHPTPACSGFSSLATSTASVWSRTTLLGKIATGSEGTSFTVTGFSGADAKECAVLVVQDWAGSALPTNIVTTPDASSNTTVTIPGITIASAGSLDIAIVGYGGNSDQGAPPNFSAWGDSFSSLIDASPTSGGGHYAGLGIATATRASAGARGSTTVTSAVSDVAANIRLEVAPAAAGGSAITGASGAATGSSLPGRSAARTALTSAAGVATASTRTGRSAARSALTSAAGAASASALGSTVAAAGTLTSASGAATASALSSTATAVSSLSAASGGASASTVATAATAAAALTAASGAATAGTLVGSGLTAGASGISPATGAATSGTVAGAATAHAAVSPSAGAGSAQTLAGASVSRSALSAAQGAASAATTAGARLAAAVIGVASGVASAAATGAAQAVAAFVAAAGQATAAAFRPAGLALVTAHATTVPAARRTVILARAARQAVLRAAVRRVTVQELD